MTDLAAFRADLLPISGGVLLSSSVWFRS